MAEQELTKDRPRTSRVGKLPIALPKGVSVNVANDVVHVKGAKGELTWTLPRQTAVEVVQGKVHVKSSAAGRDGARLQGLVRALINNMVKGTSEGFTRTLELVGTGYRAEVKGGALHLIIGFSHPVIFELPKTVTAVVPADSKGTQIVLTSPDRALLGQIAAQVRGTRPPEPYGGKGVRYRGEKVREKAGKAGKGGAKGGK